jgi:hypothetical protein
VKKKLQLSTTMEVLPETLLKKLFGNLRYLLENHTLPYLNTLSWYAFFEISRKGQGLKN